MLTLDSARLKVERARRHFDDLTSELGAFEGGEPFDIESVEDSGTVRVRVTIREAVPDTLALIFGDCIHNLRSALDHVVHEAVGKSAVSRCEWPMPNADGKGPSGREWKKRIETKCPGGGQAAALRQYIHALQPFRGGQDEYLWLLHRLDIIDKHRLLVTVCAATDEVRTVVWGDAVEVSEDDPDKSKVVPNAGLLDVTWIPDVRFPLEDGTLIQKFTADEWSKVESIKLSLSTAVGEVSLPVSGQKLLPTTRDLIQHVDRLLDDLTQQFGPCTP